MSCIHPYIRTGPHNFELLKLIQHHYNGDTFWKLLEIKATNRLYILSKQQNFSKTLLKITSSFSKFLRIQNMSFLCFKVTDQDKSRSCNQRENPEKLQEGPELVFKHCPYIPSVGSSSFCMLLPMLLVSRDGSIKVQIHHYT